MRFGIVVFPGSNCDFDCHYVTSEVLAQPTTLIWHQEKSLPPIDVLIIPGGFSYGDYLRAGAIARFSPIMDAVIDFAQKGGFVLGICNGFQILTEAGLLPGALLQNRSTKFICEWTSLRVESNQCGFTHLYEQGEKISLPIAHADGSYYLDADGLSDLEKNNQVVFRYVSETGETTAKANPNGSVNHIAGIRNKAGNVLGMMPHPERAAEAILGGRDGFRLFQSLQSPREKK